MLIISDFSKTFTRTDMPTTWSVFAKSGLLGEEYIADRTKLHDENFHFEQEGNVEKTDEWFLKHARLFPKYHLTESMMHQVVMDDRFFSPRTGVREFLDYITERNIPLIIVTSGISNLVRMWFQERFQYAPEAIFGNEFVVDNGVVSSFVETSLMCPLSKRVDIDFTCQDDDIMLIGDNTEDVEILGRKIRSVGFADTDRGFDRAIGKTASMMDIVPYIPTDNGSSSHNHTPVGSTKNPSRFHFFKLFPTI